MKVINIDGEEYVKKADVDKLLEKKKDNGFSVIKPYGLCDIAHVMVMGTAKLPSTSKAVYIDASYLYDAVKIIKQLGTQSIVIGIVDENMPLVIGHEITKDNRLSGLIIAPRLERDK